MLDSDDDYEGSDNNVDDDDDIIEVHKYDYLASIGAKELVRKPPVVSKHPTSYDSD